MEHPLDMDVESGEESTWTTKLSGVVSRATKTLSEPLKTVSFKELRRLVRKGDKVARSLYRKLSRKGLRRADGVRTAAETRKVFEQNIPACHRQDLASADAFVSSNDWSHITPYSAFDASSKKASANASNGMFETPASNRARGATSMTRVEQARISLSNNLPTIKRAGVIGAAINGTLSAAVHGYSVYQGEESVSDAAVEVAKDAAVGALQGVTMAALHVLCPPAALAVDVGLGVYTAYSIGQAGLAWYSSPPASGTEEEEEEEEEAELQAILDACDDAEEELGDDGAACAHDQAADIPLGMPNAGGLPSADGGAAIACAAA